MAVSRVKTWVAGEVLTATDHNAEHDNVLDNGQDLGFPRTKAADFDGQTLQLDEDGDTTLRASTNDQIDIAIGGTDTFRFTAAALYIVGKRVLTSKDRADFMGEVVRFRAAEARLAELESSGILMSQLNNF